MSAPFASNPKPKTAAPPRRSIARSILVWCGRILLVLVVLLLTFPLNIQVALRLLFGWIGYAGRTIPLVPFDWPAILLSVAIFLLATAVLHRWLSRGGVPGIPPAASWPFPKTAKITLLGVVLFAASIALTGVVHQIGWLASGPITRDGSLSLQNREFQTIRGIWYGLRMYAEDDGGKFPDSLLELVPMYLQSERLLFATVNPSSEGEEFLYFNGYTRSTASNWIVLAAPHPTDGWRTVALLDGSAKLISETEFQKCLAAQHRTESDE